MNSIATKITGIALAATIAALPISASAQSAAYRHRQKTKNTWRNLGYAGAAVGALGLITHNSTLAIGGLAGGAYSAYRYEQDRKSQNRMRHSHYMHRRSRRHHHR